MREWELRRPTGEVIYHWVDTGFGSTWIRDLGLVGEVVYFSRESAEDGWVERIRGKYEIQKIPTSVFIPASQT